MEQQLSFTQDDQEIDQPLSITPESTTLPPTPQVAERRARKYAYTYGKDYQEALNSLSGGGESFMRQQAATLEDIEWQQNKNDIIKRIIDKAGQEKKQVTPEQVDILRSMTRQEYQSDPNTVFERKYAQKYVKDSVVENATSQPEGLWSKAFRENPEATSRNLKIAMETGAKFQYIDKINEDLDNEAEQRGYLRKVWDFAKSVTPGISWINQTRILGEAGWNYLALPGKTKREQINHILALPTADAIKAIDSSIATLKQVNFNDAKGFAEALKSYTSGDQLMDSSVGVADIASMPYRTAAKLLGLAGRVGGKVSGSIFKDTARATELVTTDVAKLPPIKEVQQEVFRDLYGGVKPVNYEHQLDLFRGDPRQGDLFPSLRAGEAQTPPSTSGLPPGKLRSTYKPIAEQESESNARAMLPGRSLGTGRFEPGQGAYVQQPLDLRGGVGQRSFDFTDTSGRRIKESAGSGETLQYPTYEKYLEEARKAGFEKEALNREGFLKTREKEIQKYVEAPAQEAVRNVYSKGGSPYSSNAFGPGSKGVEYIDAKGNKAFEPLVQSSKTITAQDQQIALNGIVKATGETTPSGAGSVLPITGNAPSALYGAMERAQKAQEGTLRLAEGMPSYMDPGNFFGNSKALDNAAINAATERANNRFKGYEQTLDNSQRVTVVPKEVQARGFEEASSKLLDRFTHKFNDSIIDVVHLPAEMFKSNVGHAVLRLGKLDKTLFTSRENAMLYAKDMYSLADDEFKIYVGNKSDYYIGIPTAITRNSDGTLNVLQQLKNVVETSIFTLLSKARVADDYITEAHAGMRKVAAHGQQGVREYVRENIAEQITKIGRKASKEVETVINDFGDLRKWYESAAEFESAFLARHKKVPSPEQVETAFIYKQGQDMDFMNRNLGMYRDKASQGAEQFTVRTSKGVVEPFEGIQLAKLPWGRSEDFTVAVVKPNEDIKMAWGHQMDQGKATNLTKAEADNLITKEGYVVIQTFNPSEKPLSKLFPELTTPVNYILTKSHDVKPLKWEQLKYEPGPHSIYPYEFYTKQAKIAVGHLGKSFYYGDNTLWNFSTEAEAKMWTDRLNVGRVLFNNKDPNFDAWLASNLPFTKQEFQGLKNHFDFDVPFSITRAGKSVFETDDALKAVHPDVINFHKSSHNPQNFMDRSFVQERNELLQNPTDAGGILKLEKAKQLDAYAALQRGINQSIRGMWLNDYKVGSTLQWIENYATMMEPSLDKLRATPLFYLYNPKPLKVALTGNLYERSVAMEAERQAIVNFIGQGSEYGNAVTVLQNKIMNSVYERMGVNTANAFADHHLSFIKDPIPFFRGLAAHTKIGLFSPVAGIQQAMVMGNVAAISGIQHAVPATAAAFLMNGLTHTAEPAILNAVAKRLTKFGWKEAEAKEMMEAYRSTGLNTVGAEASLRADNFDNKLFKGTIGTWMDKGFLFFNMGERLGRKGAFAAAYREWRAVEPTAKLTDEILAGIGNRADTMTGNMTSASLANIQQGALSIPLQFTTYFKHMAELMLGGRITTAEKARLFAFNSMMYGIPVAAGVGGLPGAIGGAISGGAKDGVTGAVTHGALAAVGMWPVYDDIKEEMIRRGWDKTVNSNLFLKGLAEGIPALMIKLILDKDVEFGKTYGAGGSSVARDIIRQDKSFLETVGGASGTVAADIVSSVEPLLGKLADTFHVRNDATSGVSNSDLMKVFRNIGTFDLATRTYAAFVYGKSISKTGVEISGLDSVDAALVALRLNPKQVQDTFYKRNILTDQKQAQEKFENLAIESLRRGNQNAQQGDWKKYDEYLKDAKAYMRLGEFSPDDQSRIFRRSVDESRGIEENTARQFLKKDPGQLKINQMNPQFFTNPNQGQTK